MLFKVDLAQESLVLIELIFLGKRLLETASRQNCLFFEHQARRARGGRGHKRINEMKQLGGLIHMVGRGPHEDNYIVFGGVFPAVPVLGGLGI